MRLMNLNYKHLGMYLLAGIASGFLCELIYAHHAKWIYTRHEIWQSAGPGLVLGIMIFLAGRYISGNAPRNTWFSPLILILACWIGWFLAFKFAVEGYSLYGSGGIGGTCVAIGLTLAWKLNRVWLVIALTVLAGILGVLMWSLVSMIWNTFGFEVGSDSLILLFVSWQGILLLAIGIAVQIDSTKPSTDA